MSCRVGARRRVAVEFARPSRPRSADFTPAAGPYRPAGFRLRRPRAARTLKPRPHPPRTRRALAGRCSDGSV